MLKRRAYYFHSLTTMHSLYLTLGLLLVSLGGSLGCRCAPLHPQTYFCNSDFVVEAKVLAKKAGNNQFGQEVKYIVEVLKDYKNSYQPIRGNIEIFTSGSGATCGAFFELKQKYLILGSTTRGVRITSSCSGNRLVTSLTTYQSKALRNGIYRNNCGCEIVDCTFRAECPTASKERCVIPDNSDNFCYFNKDACTRSRRGCSWDTRACRQPINNVYGK
ncbi:metalloproteinase inhibitor 3-like [Crassostrea virginica]